MMRTIYISFLILTCSHLVGQDHDFIELQKAENKLERLFLELYSDTLPDTEPVLREIDFFMQEALTMPGAMDYQWSGLSRIGVRSSDDNRIRIFTWHVMDDPDNYRYFGFIQVGVKNDKMELFSLKDNFSPQGGVYRTVQTTGAWYGKLYYGIVTKQEKRKTYYTLLGLDFNNSRSNIKSVEVMTILRNKPKFEQEMFFNGNERVDRVVLEYSNQAAITVRYEPKLDMITFDHLVPIHPVYQNNLEFYGPDGSFDGLKFEKGTWILQNDVDARLEY